jgi:hypothetical protein
VDVREFDEKDPWGLCLSSNAYAICSTFHTTLKATPGQLMFGRDMVLPIIFMAEGGGRLSNNAKKKWPVIIEEKMPPE